MILDQLLDDFERPVLQHAGCALLLAADTEVVRVGRAELALGVAHAQPAATAPAPDRAFEVMVVDSLLLAVRLGAQHLLHPLPCFVVDQRLVFPGVLDIVVGDDALVIGRRQDAVELTDGQFLLRRVRPASAL